MLEQYNFKGIQFIYFDSREIALYTYNNWYVKQFWNFLSIKLISFHTKYFIHLLLVIFVFYQRKYEYEY